MIEQEVYKAIKPLLEGYTEGLYWDFKKTLTDVSEITKDILAFSNSNFKFACLKTPFVLANPNQKMN